MRDGVWVEGGTRNEILIEHFFPPHTHTCCVVWGPQCNRESLRAVYMHLVLARHVDFPF